MPVTAKLSRKFYETFGDDIANELVEWFNSVDATYRADLRELNELNFSRFDAKLEQRVAELRQDMAAAISAVRAEIIDLRRHTDIGFERLQVEMAKQRAELIKWMFLFWLPTVLALIGLYTRR